MKVSLSGILDKNRIKCRRDIRFMLDEFLKHYDMAKVAHKKCDAEMVGKFFDLYVTYREETLKDIPIKSESKGGKK